MVTLLTPALLVALITSAVKEALPIVTTPIKAPKASVPMVALATVRLHMAMAIINLLTEEATVECKVINLLTEEATAECKVACTAANKDSVCMAPSTVWVLMEVNLALVHMADSTESVCMAPSLDLACMAINQTQQAMEAAMLHRVLSAPPVVLA